MDKLTVKDKEIKKPTVLGLAGYIAVVVAFGLLALFAGRIARGMQGSILCIYVAVLPKYIFGLALVLAGVDGIFYGIRFFRDDPRVPMLSSGIQTIALAAFLFLIFPIALREGVPSGSTYNIMRALIGLMLLITAWDFARELRRFLKSSASEET